MKSMLRRLATASLALAVVFGSAQAAVGAKVTQDGLPVFDSPTYSEETYAGYLNSGETVGVVEVRGDWAKITRDGKIGYTGSEYLTRISSENTYESRVTGYTTRCVTVYKGASTSSGTVTTLPWGTAVYVTATNGSYCHVENESGSVSGYIYSGYLSHSQPTYTTGYTTQEVTVYANPSSSSAKLGTLPRGTAVRVIGTSGECCQVLNDDGMSCGYIYSGYLSKTEVVNKVTTGYTTREVAVYSSASTSSSVLIRLNTGTEVTVFDVNGSFCKVRNSSGSMVGYILANYLTQTPPSSGNGSSDNSSSLDTLKSNVVMMDWSTAVDSVLSRGSYYTLYDIRNNQTIRVKYTTGSSHMDIEPATAEDTAKLLECLGGSWTYVRTPVILIANGRYIAASLYGEPHGGTDTVSGNNMDGVVCLHLANSRTHGSDRVDEDHQAAIQAAYNWAHS